ncbi:MAG: WD40 repeat domain-containing protein, partial [Anaerolineae bacterium]|nr:WD40 repeat domain-containing protein [Anaerolineae bacterium]
SQTHILYRAFSMEWNPEGTLLAVGRSGGIISVFDTNLQPVRSFEAEKRGAIENIVWKSDSSELAATLIPYYPNVPSHFVFVDLNTGTLDMGLPGTRLDYAGTVAWSPDGSQLAVFGVMQDEQGRYTRLIEIWNGSRDTRSASWVLSGDGGISKLRWIGENQLLAAQSNGIFIYEPQTGIPTFSVPAYLAEESYEAISRDNSRVAVVINPLDVYLSSRIRVWDLPAGTLALDITLEEHIYGLSWSPDNRYLSVISSDGDVATIKILDASTGEYVDTASGLEWVTTVAWHPIENKVAYSMFDNSYDNIVEGFHIPNIVTSCDAATQTISAGDVTGFINAINTANSNPDADVIGLEAGTYTFTTAHIPLNALPAITSDTTICSIEGATLTRRPEYMPVAIIKGRWL